MNIRLLIRLANRLDNNKNISAANYIDGLIITAGRLEDTIKKYPQLEDKIRELSQHDPSKENKYLEWATKQLSAGHSINDIKTTLDEFHKKVQRLKDKNIHSYDLPTLKEELSKIEELSKTKQKSVSKASGAIVIYDSPDTIVNRIDNKDACIAYGAGTKWCITQKNEKHYESYVALNVLFYFIINKNLEQTNPLYKIAVSIERDLDNKILKIQYFDAKDENIDENIVSANVQNWGAIKSAITNDIPAAPDGQIVKTIKQLNDTSKSKEELEKIFNNLDFDNKDLISKSDKITNPVALNIIYAFINKLKSDISSAKYNTTDPDKIKEFSQHPSWQVRHALVERNSNIPPEVILALSKDPDGNIRAEVASSKNTPPNVLASMSNDIESYVVKRIAENKNTPAETINELVKNSKPNTDISVGIANNHLAPQSALESIYNSATTINDNGPERAQILKNLASNISTPLYILKILSKVNGFNGAEFMIPPKDMWRLDSVRAHVADNPSTPPETLIELAKIDDRDVQQNIATNKNSPAEALHLLINNKYTSIRQHIAEHPNTSTEDRLNLYKSLPPRSFEATDRVFRIQSLPSDFLEKSIDIAVNRNDISVLYDIAEHKNTPPAALTKILKIIHSRVFDGLNSSSKDIESKLSRNKNTPEDILFQLYNNELNWPSLAANKNIPQKLFNDLYESQSPKVLENLIDFSPLITPELLEELSKNPNPHIRKAIIYHPNTPINIIKEFARIHSNSLSSQWVGEAAEERLKELKLAHIKMRLVKLANALDNSNNIKIADQIDLLIKLAGPLTLYHGSPYGGLKSFEHVKPPIYFTPDENIARQYAVGTILAAQKNPGGIIIKVPTVYKVNISINNPIDFRIKDDVNFYINARQAYIDTNKEDEDRFFTYPKINATGFIDSSSKLPMYSNSKAIIKLFGIYGRKSDAIWVDEGTQGISLAIFDGSKVKILDSYPV